MPAKTQNTNQPRAIVVGLDTLQGIQAARILARRGVPVIGVARNPNSFYCRTNVCERILYTDTKGDELVDTLRALGPEMGQKAVLVPSTDMSVLVISRNRQALSPWYHVLLPEAEVVEMLVDKPSFYTYAQEEGLPIPRTFLLRSRADAEAAAASLAFPCILKPSKKTTLWEQHAAGSVYKVASAAEFLHLYQRASQWTDLLVIQETVEGGEDSLFAVNCYFSADSKPLATFVSRKLRQWPVETGNGCLREEVRNDTVLRETLRLFEKVGYHGLGYVEMKRDERSGEHFFIEANIGRPTGGSAIAEAGGVELLYAMYCDAIGWPLPAQLEQTYRGVKWLFLAEDLQSAYHYWRRGDLSLAAWWRSLRGRKTYALLSWQDPRPALGQLQVALKGAIASITSRFGRRAKRGRPENYQRKEEQQHGTI